MKQSKHGTNAMLKEYPFTYLATIKQPQGQLTHKFTHILHNDKYILQEGPESIQNSQDFVMSDPDLETMYFATSAQQVSLSAFSSGISKENSSSNAITSSTLSKLSRHKSF